MLGPRCSTLWGEERGGSLAFLFPTFARIANSNSMNKSESDQEDNDDINDNDWSYGSEKKGVWGSGETWRALGVRWARGNWVTKLHFVILNKGRECSFVLFFRCP